MALNSDDTVKAKKVKRRFVFEFLFSLVFAGVFFIFENTSMMVLGLILALGVTPARASAMLRIPYQQSAELKQGR